MRTALLLPLTLLAAAPAFAETRTYDFRNFKNIDISAGYEVIFTQSNQTSGHHRVRQFQPHHRRRRPATRSRSAGRKTPTSAAVFTTLSASRRRTSNEAELNAGVKFSVDGLQVDNLDLDINAGVEADFSRVNARSIRLDANAGVEVEARWRMRNTRASTRRLAWKSTPPACAANPPTSMQASAHRSACTRSIVSSPMQAWAPASASPVLPRTCQKHASLGGSVSVGQ